MKTTFRQLDDWIKYFIAMNVSHELFVQIDKKVDFFCLIDIFEDFDLDIFVSEDETITIQKNTKLESAVKKITATF